MQTWKKSKLEIQNWTKKHEDVKCLLTGKQKKTEEKETSQKWRQAVTIRERDKYKGQGRSSTHIRRDGASLKVVSKAILEGGTVWKTVGLAFLKSQCCERNRWVTVLDFKKLKVEN